MSKMVIVAGPSGVGKSSFVEQIDKDLDYIEDTKTYTTRGMRKGESQGNPYHFIEREKFEQLIKEDFFVEWANVHDNLYGTPLHQITDAWKTSKVIIMDVDVQGAKTFITKYPEALTIFIKPPSMDALRNRLLGRDGGLTQNIDLRLKNAEIELSKAGKFHHTVLNDDFDESYSQFKKIVEEYANKD